MRVKLVGSLVLTNLIFNSSVVATGNKFYLHSNGVTVKCENATVGESGEVEGVTYSKIDDKTDLSIYSGDVDADKACTSGIADMSDMFSSMKNFNKDISGWDTSSVTNMSKMFSGTSFNQDIGDWNVSSVTDMSSMFSSTSFNQGISSWDVSSVTDMSSMFARALSFNQDIGNWDVSSVEDMPYMFYMTPFNQDIGDWNVSSVEDMSNMFEMSSFNQDISSWNVSSVTDMKNMFNFIALSTANYDALLNGWSKLQLQPNVEFSAGQSYYSSSASNARQKIVDSYSWSITDKQLTPADDFTFIDLSNQELSTTVTSNQIVVSGLVDGESDTISISGSGCEYLISKGAIRSIDYTSKSDIISNSDIINIRVTTPPTYSTTLNCILNIGEVSDTFSVTTKAEPYSSVNLITSNQNSIKTDSSKVDEFESKDKKIIKTTLKNSYGSIFNFTLESPKEKSLDRDKKLTI